MRNSLEKLVHHIGTIHGQDISSELQNRKPIVIPEPQYSQAVLDDCAAKEVKRITRHNRVQAARRGKVRHLQIIIAAGEEPAADAAIELAVLTNQIEEADDNISVPLAVSLDGPDRAQWDSQWNGAMVYQILRNFVRSPVAFFCGGYL